MLLDPATCIWRTRRLLLPRSSTTWATYLPSGETHRWPCRWSSRVMVLPETAYPRAPKYPINTKRNLMATNTRIANGN